MERGHDDGHVTGGVMPCDTVQSYMFEFFGRLFDTDATTPDSSSPAVACFASLASPRLGSAWLGLLSLDPIFRRGRCGPFGRRSRSGSGPGDTCTCASRVDRLFSHFSHTKARSWSKDSAAAFPSTTPLLPGLSYTPPPPTRPSIRNSIHPFGTRPVGTRTTGPQDKGRCRVVSRRSER